MFVKLVHYIIQHYKDISFFQNFLFLSWKGLVQ